VELETAAPPVVTTITALARGWVVATAGVHSESTWGALDGDVKLPGGRLASETVGPREDRLGTQLGRFVELVREAHNTQGPGQIAVIVNAKIVVDACDESGDEVGICVVGDRLKERGATRLVVVEITLFGKETIVQLKSVGEIEDAVVGPGRELDWERRVEPRNCEFENTPQEVVAVVRLHTDHVDNGGDLFVRFW
jgi:hypothetical protein